MNYFFSGIVGPEFARRCAFAATHKLFSCHDAYIAHIAPWMNAVHEKGARVREMMLDSGAFTAWSKGDKVSIKRLISTYGRMLKQYEKEVDQVWFINLDVIPGQKGGAEPSQQEIVEAMHESDSNYALLVEAFGNRVLPVVHQGEPFSRLDDLASMADYICVSPRNDLPERIRTLWAQEMHTRLPAGKRTHGLATTGNNIVQTVAWHSVDSAAWVIRAGYGMTYIAIGNDLRSIAISQESPTRYDVNGHYDSMSPALQAHVRAVVEGNGFTVQELRTNTRLRAANSVLEIAKWSKTVEQRPLVRNVLIGD
jgi:hypothetical protein